ncbi:MAG: hypothetical protein Q8K82_06515 [Gemmatimonadaceae bacterium]|nr:hypothetical protein [Gemmatimonadaceae bacterium]
MTWPDAKPNLERILEPNPERILEPNSEPNPKPNPKPRADRNVEAIRRAMAPPAGRPQ